MNKERIRKILSYQIPPGIVNTTCLVIMICLSCILFVWNAEAIAVISDKVFTFISWSHSSFFWSACVTLAFVWGIIYCLTGNLIVSYIVMEIVTICWGIANKIMLFTRDRFISVAELKVVGEAAEVKVDFGAMFHPVIIVLIVIGGIMGMMLFLLKRKILRDNGAGLNKKKFLIARSIGIMVLILMFVSVHAKTPQILMDTMSPFRDTGDVVWFCQSLFNNVTEDISFDEVQEIYRDFVELGIETDVVSEQRPNVIVVMSEAFWNINNLNGIVEASENPMDKYFEIAKDAITGQVAVNIYGGGTNNSEFEFLTGINARYIESPDCYGAYFVKEQESIVTYMEELGYYTMAFHPYDREFWERDMGYKNMGFEAFYSDVDFDNREMCHGYISDKSMTQEIIARFEEQKMIAPEQPIFTFAVSVQNHVNDMKKFDEASGKLGCTGITTTIKVGQPDEETRENVEEYYNGMHESVEALEELVNYFESYEEDTVIVFFGDHAPLFVKLLCDTEGKEAEMNLYRTPYMIWTNYENDYESYGDISISYLSSVLIEYLGLPKPQQYYLNKYMLEHYIINTNYEQESLESLDEQRVIDMMNIVLYFCNNSPNVDMALPYWQIVD